MQAVAKTKEIEVTASQHLTAIFDTDKDYRKARDIITGVLEEKNLKTRGLAASYLQDNDKFKRHINLQQSLALCTSLFDLGNTEIDPKFCTTDVINLLNGNPDFLNEAKITDDKLVQLYGELGDHLLLFAVLSSRTKFVGPLFTRLQSKHVLGEKFNINAAFSADQVNLVQVAIVLGNSGLLETLLAIKGVSHLAKTADGVTPLQLIVNLKSVPCLAAFFKTLPRNAMQLAANNIGDVSSDTMEDETVDILSYALSGEAQRVAGGNYEFDGDFIFKVADLCSKFVEFTPKLEEQIESSINDADFQAEIIRIMRPSNNVSLVDLNANITIEESPSKNRAAPPAHSPTPPAPPKELANAPGTAAAEDKPTAQPTVTAAAPAAAAAEEKPQAQPTVTAAAPAAAAAEEKPKAQPTVTAAAPAAAAAEDKPKAQPTVTAAAPAAATAEEKPKAQPTETAAAPAAAAVEDKPQAQPTVTAAAPAAAAAEEKPKAQPTETAAAPAAAAAEEKPKAQPTETAAAPAAAAIEDKPKAQPTVTAAAPAPAAAEAKPKAQPTVTAAAPAAAAAEAKPTAQPTVTPAAPAAAAAEAKPTAQPIVKAAAPAAVAKTPPKLTAQAPVKAAITPKPVEVAAPTAPPKSPAVAVEQAGALPRPIFAPTSTSATAAPRPPAAVPRGTQDHTFNPLENTAMKKAPNPYTRGQELTQALSLEDDPDQANRDALARKQQRGIELAEEPADGATVQNLETVVELENSKAILQRELMEATVALIKEGDEFLPVKKQRITDSFETLVEHDEPRARKLLGRLLAIGKENPKPQLHEYHVYLLSGNIHSIETSHIELEYIKQEEVAGTDPTHTGRYSSIKLISADEEQPVTINAFKLEHLPLDGTYKFYPIRTVGEFLSLDRVQNEILIDNTGRTNLHWAAIGGNAAVLDIMLAANQKRRTDTPEQTPNIPDLFSRDNGGNAVGHYIATAEIYTMGTTEYVDEDTEIMTERVGSLNLQAVTSIVDATKDTLNKLGGPALFSVERNSKGEAPLDLTLLHNNLNALDYLVKDCGVNIFDTEGDGSKVTLLHLGAALKSVEPETLLKCGSNYFRHANLKDANGYSALTYALAVSNLPLALVLLKFAADTQAKSNNGDTPLTIALSVRSDAFNPSTQEMTLHLSTRIPGVTKILARGGFNVWDPTRCVTIEELRSFRQLQTQWGPKQLFLTRKDIEVLELANIDAHDAIVANYQATHGAPIDDTKKDRKLTKLMREYAMLPIALLHNRNSITASPQDAALCKANYYAARKLSCCQASSEIDRVEALEKLKSKGGLFSNRYKTYRSAYVCKPGAEASTDYKRLAVDVDVAKKGYDYNMREYIAIRGQTDSWFMWFLSAWILHPNRHYRDIAAKVVTMLEEFPSKNGGRLPDHEDLMAIVKWAIAKADRRLIHGSYKYGYIWQTDATNSSFRNRNSVGFLMARQATHSTASGSESESERQQSDSENGHNAALNAEDFLDNGAGTSNTKK